MTETFRVLVERFHKTGRQLGALSCVVEATDKGEAARIAITQAVEDVKDSNARQREAMQRRGVTWTLYSEDEQEYRVREVRKSWSSRDLHATAEPQ